MNAVKFVLCNNLNTKRIIIISRISIPELFLTLKNHNIRIRRI